MVLLGLIFRTKTARSISPGVSQRISACLLALAAFSHPAPAQQKASPSDPSPYLSATPALSHTLTASGEVHDQLSSQAVASYSVSLDRGQATTLRFLEQQGEIGAIWIEPGDHAGNIRRNDSGRNALIRFTLVASESGRYEIRVRCLSPSGCALAAGADAPRTAQAADASRMKAEEEEADGDRLRIAATADSRAAASVAYDQALSIATQIHDPWLTRRVLYPRARLALETRQYAQARDFMLQAVSLPDSDGDPADIAVCWKVLGYSYAYIGELDHALSAYQQAQKYYAQNGDALNQEILHENAARAHRAMGENGVALDELTQALNEAQSIHDDRGVIACLEELGNIHLSRGDLQPALDAYRQAIQSPEMAKNPVTQAHVLNGLGHVYTLLGEYESAQAALEQSLALWQQLKDPMGQAYALDGEAFLAYSQANYPQAIKMQTAALDLVLGTDLSRERASILEELGESYEAAGQKENAIAALSKAQALAGGLHLLAIEAPCLRSLGEIAFSSGDAVAAAKYYDQAGSLDAITMDKLEEAALLADRARLERSLGHLDQARTGIDSAIATIESSRTSIQSSEARSSYFDNQRDYYDFYISLLMEMDRLHPGQGYASLAFDISERARARSLLDTLHENGIETERGVDPALIGQERGLSDQAEAKLQQLIDADPKDRPALRTQLASIESQYGKVEAEIRARGSGYAAIVRGKTISAGDLSKRVLDPQTILLEYWLGKSESYLWAITSDSIATYRLPPARDLQAKASSLYAAFTARNRAVPNEVAEARQLRIERAERDADVHGQALARLLLQPASAALERHSTVVIVAEGALSSLPFQALPFQGQPLMQTRQVVYLPSASLLPELRRNRAHAPGQLLAVFADPVFSPSDPRVHAGAGPPAAPLTSDAEDLTRSAGDLGLNGFPRLAYSRQEAEEIGQLLPAPERKIALDFDANRQAVLDTDWSPYTIVHFSTHALVDDVHPDLSGIVLSLVSPAGSQVDGFLRVRDIYKLHMPANLVVLSACRTALGKNTRGEGVIGLSRAFSYAGSRAVIATLWNVNDRATAALMEHFYQGLLKQGLPPALALAQAQRTMAQSRDWHSPYFWAPFVLLGDWEK